MTNNLLKEQYGKEQKMIESIHKALLNLYDDFKRESDSITYRYYSDNMDLFWEMVTGAYLNNLQICFANDRLNELVKSFNYELNKYKRVDELAYEDRLCKIMVGITNRDELKIL